MLQKLLFDEAKVKISKPLELYDMPPMTFCSYSYPNQLRPSLHAASATCSIISVKSTETFVQLITIEGLFYIAVNAAYT